MVTIRPAQETDINIVARIMSGQTPWIDLRMTFEQCRAGITSNIKHAVVAVTDSDEVAGYLRWRPEGFIGQPYVSNLVLDPEWHGRGVGRTLLEWMGMEAFENLHTASSLFARERLQCPGTGILSPSRVPGSKGGFLTSLSPLMRT